MHVAGVMTGMRPTEMTHSSSWQGTWKTFCWEYWVWRSYLYNWRGYHSSRQ